MKKRTTLLDIAKLANVSPSTVSRVLNHDQTLSVTAETKVRVFSAAEELSYERKTPQRINQDRVGYFTTYTTEDELNDVYYLSLRVELKKQLLNQGIEMTAISRSLADAELQELSAIFCVGIFDQPIKEWLDSLGVPLLFIDSNANQEKYDVVYFDDEAATIKVMDYLFQMGHQAIGFIGGIEELEYSEFSNQPVTSDGRVVAYSNYMMEKGLYDPSYIKQGVFSPESGYRLFKELMQAENPPTAVFIGNDNLAVGCYNAANELGYKIPEDISLFGFNDLPQARYLVPPLTTVRLDMEQLVEVSIDLMTSKLETKRTFPVKVIVPTELVIRDSVSALSKEDE